MTPTLSAALWGCAGALIWSASNWTTCAFTAKQNGGSALRCTVDALVALPIGCLAAAAFAPALGGFLHLTNIRDLNALAAGVGLLAKPTAPKVVDLLSSLAANLLSEKVVKLFKGSSDAPEP